VSGPIPRDWQVTPEWMTRAVSSQHPDARVSHVRLVDRSDGTSSRARFEMEYAYGAGPRTVFAKSKGNWLRRVLHAMTANAFIEGRLYESGLDLPVEHPVFYYGAVDTRRLNDLIVMEDVCERGAVLNDATTPLSPDEVARGLQGLARMHSRFWEYTPGSHPELAWVRRWQATRMFQFLLRIGCRRGTPRLQDFLPSQIVAQGPAMMVQSWASYLRTVNTGPATLLHGDAHVGNTYLLPDGELGFYDWGVVRKGNWSFDVGYFIVSSLTETDRREHAKTLLAGYLAALDLPTAGRPSPDEAWLRFRASPAYGLAIWVTTGAEDNYQAPKICQELSKRFASAFTELDTPSAIKELAASNWH
jgi:Phosphotransferase enzyme family